MLELKIDPEFQGKIPPLSKEEFKQLSENILSDGEVYEPIAVWNGVIIDGHNRWRIIQEHPEIKFRVKEMEFRDKWEAFDWMYRKQLGRRNLTEEQKAYMIGKMYEARKNTDAFKGNQYTQKSGDGQNVQNQSRREIKDGTAGQIGKEFGMSGRTVRRNESFAEVIDSIKEVSPKVAETILKGDSGISKEFISSLPSFGEEQKQAGIKAVIEGPEAVTEFKNQMKSIPNQEEETDYIPIGSSAYNNEDFRDQVSSFPKDLDDTLRIFLMSHGNMLSKRACRREFRLMLNEIKKVVKKYWEVVNEH